MPTPTVDFAGLTKGEFNLVVFEDENQLRNILERLSVRVDGQRIMGETGSVRTCESCNRELTLATLGQVLPGSTLMICDDPFCVTSYVAEHLPDT